MTLRQLVLAVGTFTGFAGLVLAGTLISTPRIHADGKDRDRDKDKDKGGESRIEIGLQMAPVPLTYPPHERKLVGLGSYFVNAVSGCNGCHSAGPTTEYAPGAAPGTAHNPYFRSGFFVPPKMLNPKTYLGGGRDFGQIGPPIPSNVSPHIVSRNLTPDHTGLPEGGATFSEFFETIRFGIDHDHLHPNCSAKITTNCFNPPFDGNLLQVMPWPEYQDWTEHDLLAIFTYLKAVPCIPGPGHVC